MVVHLSDHIKGLVPRTHLSDIVLKNPEKKYMEGMKIKCRVSPVFQFVLKPLRRSLLGNKICNLEFQLYVLCLRVNMFLQVLSVDAGNKKLYLTRKKALVESSLPLFLSYADARPGRVSHGYIVCIKGFGCIVRFYNNIKGLVPLSELSSEAIISPEEVFYVGQVRRSTRAEDRPLLMSHVFFCVFDQGVRQPV